MVELLVLSSNDLEEILAMKDVMDAVEEAFKGFALGEASMPPIVPMEVHKHNGFWAIKSAMVNNSDIIGLKLSCSYFDNPKKYNLPSIMGVVVVADSRNGIPLAVLDGSRITAYRTGAIAGVAAKHLARTDSRVAAIFGAGTQGRTQLMGLNEVLKLDEVRIYDIVSNLSSKYACEMSELLGLRVKPAETISGALEGCDIVSTATPSREPYIRHEWIDKGTHITTVGSDEGDKQELESSVYDKAKIIVDERDEALKKKYLKQAQIYAELGEIIVGKKPGRTSREEITIMDSTGLGIQDLAAGYAAYSLAKRKNAGTWLKFA